jgi:hypothetical protein
MEDGETRRGDDERKTEEGRTIEAAKIAQGLKYTGAAGTWMGTTPCASEPFRWAFWLQTAKFDGMAIKMTFGIHYWKETGGEAPALVYSRTNCGGRPEAFGAMQVPLVASIAAHCRAHFYGIQVDMLRSTHEVVF